MSFILNNVEDRIEYLALHAELVNSILLHDVKLGQFEVDEMWTFVKKKQKNVEPGSPNSDIEGEAWILTFITIWSYLIVAYEIGKRTKKTCEKLFEKIF